MARKKKKAEEEHGDPFVVLMTALSMILLAFFIVMCSLSVVDAKRVKRALGSLVGSFGPLPGGTMAGKGKNAPSRAGGAAPSPQQTLQAFQGKSLGRATVSLTKMESLFLEKGLGKKMRVSVTTEGVKVAFTGDVLFKSGQAKIDPRMDPILDTLGQAIMETKRPVRIEGHTDNVPIHTKKYPSNWELSVARAVNVLRYLVKKGYVMPDRISAVGYGPYRPVAPNDTPAHRALNRRIDVIFLGTYL